MQVCVLAFLCASSGSAVWSMQGELAAVLSKIQHPDQEPEGIVRLHALLAAFPEVTQCIHYNCMWPHVMCIRYTLDTMHNEDQDCKLRTAGFCLQALRPCTLSFPHSQAAEMSGVSESTKGKVLARVSEYEAHLGSGGTPESFIRGSTSQDLKDSHRSHTLPGWCC